MDLENRLRRKSQVVRATPSQDVQSKIEQGNRFIVVDEDFSLSNVPRGYSLINMDHRGNNSKILIPQRLLYFVANPGEGDPDEALDEVADFYGDAKDHESDMISGGERSVQQVSWATSARNSYEVYLINRLVGHKPGASDEDGEPVAQFNETALNEIGLNDPYVNERARAMAAIALGVSGDRVKEFDISGVLKHITVRKESKEKLSREEFKEVTCWAGSHYELKSEFSKQGDDETEYKIEYKHDQSHMEGVKITKGKSFQNLDSSISELEDEISKHRASSGKPVGRHDLNLIRQYVNMRHIAPENPRAQLDLTPPPKAGSEQ